MNPPIEIIGAVIAGLTLAAAVMVVTSKVPIHAACFLILTLLGVAAELAILEAHTLAIFQVLIYAGAIVVLIAFTLMMMGSKKASDLEEVPVKSWRVIVGGAMSVAMLALLAYALGAEHDPMAETGVPRDMGQIEGFGTLLLGPYVLAFEIVSLVLMVGIVGAVALLRPRSDQEGKEADR